MDFPLISDRIAVNAAKTLDNLVPKKSKDAYDKENKRLSNLPSKSIFTEKSTKVCIVCKKYFLNQVDYYRHLNSLNIKVGGFCHSCKVSYLPGKECQHPLSQKTIKCLFCKKNLDDTNLKSHVCFHDLAIRYNFAKASIIAVKEKQMLIRNFKDLYKDPCEAKPSNHLSKIRNEPSKTSEHKCKICLAVFSSKKELNEHLNSLVIKMKGYCFACGSIFDPKDSCCHPVTRKLLFCYFCENKLTYPFLGSHICFHKQYECPEVKEEGTDAHFRAKIMDMVKATYVAATNNKTRAIIKQVLATLDDVKDNTNFENEKGLLTKRKDEPSSPENAGWFVKKNVIFLDNEASNSKKPITKEREVPCIYCLKYIPISLLINHENQECTEKSDEICIEVSAEDLQKTQNFDENEETSTCIYCLKEVPVTELCSHETSHEKNRPRPTRVLYSKFEVTVCNFCGKCVPGKKFHKHLFLHSKRKHLCEICGVMVSNQKRALHHLVHHGKTRKYCCDVCGKTYKMWSTFSRHKLLHKQRKLHRCPTCKKAYKGLHSLKIHMRHHMEVKPFPCLVCDETFTTKRIRDNHMVKHSK